MHLPSLLKQEEQNGDILFRGVLPSGLAIVLAVGRTSHFQTAVECSTLNVVGSQTRPRTQTEAETRADRSSRTVDLHCRDSRVPMDRTVGSS